VVGVPATPNIRLLVRLLAYLRDLRIARRSPKKSIDVDCAKALREGDVLFGRYRLIAKEDDAVLIEGRTQFIDRRVIRPARQVDPENFGPHRTASHRLPNVASSVTKQMASHAAI